MKSWSKQLEELSGLVAQLRVEKGELQQRARILESSLAVNAQHEERLHCDEVGRFISRVLLLFGGPPRHQGAA